MKKQNFKSTNFRGGSYSTVLTVVVIAILIIVNVIVNALPANVTKYDYSEEKLFTLTDQTKNLTKKLEDEVTIYLICQDGSEDDALVELLDKYKALSSKIKIKQKDPAVNPNFTSTYTSDALEDNSLIVETGKRFRVVPKSDIYVTNYTPSSTSSTGYTTSTTFEGEDAITSALDYVTTENMPKMYVISGHGESAMDSSLQSEVQRENIELVELPLATTKSIPDDADCLYMQAPTTDINADEAGVLLEYLQKGGNLFYTSCYQKGSTPNLDKVLAEYGIVIQTGIVCEGNSNYVVQNRNCYLVPVYGKHEIVNPLSEASKNMVVAFGQNITILDDKRSTLTATTLLKTTTTGYIKPVDAQTLEKESSDQTGMMTLAAAVNDKINETTESRIVVVTSPYVSNSDMNTYVSGGNFDFLLNTVSYLCEHESMISIRGKNIYSTALVVTSGQAVAWMFVLMILIPVALIATGLIVWVRRRKR